MSELIKPHKTLDNSAAVHRTKVSSVFKHKLPSRDLLRKKDSRGNILHNMPESMLSNLETPLEETTPEPEDKGEEGTPKSSTPQPKPKPRAVPRKKPVPTPSEQTKKPPQAARRSRQSSMEILDDSPTKSSSVTDESTQEDKKSETTKEAEQPFPVATRSPPSVGNKPTSERAPLPTPVARSRISSTEDAAPISPEKKDPSNLSIKEKARLAQMAFESTGEKPKPGGPPIARKPKLAVPTPSESSSEPTATESVGNSPQRGALTTAPGNDSVSSKASPVPKRKLPPGAFSIMGGVSVFGPPPTAERNKTSNATSKDETKEEEVEETTGHSQDVSPEHPKLDEEQKDSNVLESSDEQKDNKQVSEQATPATEPMEMPVEKSDVPDGVESPEVNFDVVLSWTPDVTVAWLKQVGLGSHQEAFLEKEIHGGMLFDIDGHKLKVRSKLQFSCY